MEDKLNLLDSNIPLLERYDKYLEWESQNSQISIQVIAQSLGIKAPYVEIFFDLGKLDEDEFAIIDSLEILLDHLFIIIKEDREKRNALYESYKFIIANTKEPIKSIRTFIEGSDEPLFRSTIENISPSAYFTIASYLKSSGIESGTINKSFRGFMVTIGKTLESDGQISDKQIDWIIRAITHSYKEGLNIFTNDIIKTEHPLDYVKFNEIIESIAKTK